MKKESVEKRFLDDVKDHQLTIENDGEVHRSLLFKCPGSSYYHFRLNTWPGHLCISGDMGTYVFARTHDMFDFFRMDDKDFNFSKDKQLNINTDYWAQKVRSEDKDAILKRLNQN